MLALILLHLAHYVQLRRLNRTGGVVACACSSLDQRLIKSWCRVLQGHDQWVCDDVCKTSTDSASFITSPFVHRHVARTPAQCQAFDYPIKLCPIDQYVLGHIFFESFRHLQVQRPQI